MVGMDKSCLIWIFVILIIGGGFVAYSNIKSDEAAEKKKGNLWNDVRREITKIREKKVIFLHAKPVRI